MNLCIFQRLFSTVRYLCPIPIRYRSRGLHRIIYPFCARKHSPLCPVKESRWFYQMDYTVPAHLLSEYLSQKYPPPLTPPPYIIHLNCTTSQPDSQSLLCKLALTRIENTLKRSRFPDSFDYINLTHHYLARGLACEFAAVKNVYSNRAYVISCYTIGDAVTRDVQREIPSV